jgi:Fe-S oxidoreductase
MLQIESRSFARQYELFGCVQCGKCTAGCPMAIKTKLNPRSLILRLLTAGNGFDLEPVEELWDCTTCSTCTQRCPKEVSPMEAIIGLRSAIVEQGKVHPNVKTALESTFRQGNPLTMPRDQRGAWADDLNLKSMSDGAEVLFYVGCTPSYDPRVQKVSRALVKLLRGAGVDFGVMGNAENCCGSEVRRLGEAGLFEMMVEENSKTFKELGVSRLFTVSPHCYNVYARDYPKNGMQVEHYTQALAGLIREGKLAFGGRLEKTITYHDPCYLGKHNGIFDEPRAVLAAIPGAKVVEMDRSREKSLCCEGGGGRMWLEGTNPHTRLAQSRIQEALDVGAEVLATACPFCLLTLEEALKHLNAEDKLKVMDIAELVSEAV